MQIRLFHLKLSLSTHYLVLEELGLNYELIIKDHSGIDKDKTHLINYQNFQLSKLLNRNKFQFWRKPQQS